MALAVFCGSPADVEYCMPDIINEITTTTPTNPDNRLIIGLISEDTTLQCFVVHVVGAVLGRVLFTKQLLAEEEEQAGQRAEPALGLQADFAVLL